MLEARIARCTVVQDQKSDKLVLVGVAEFFEDRVNFKAEYDWETMDKEQFIQDLREKLAEEFAVSASWVDVQPEKLLERMRIFHERFKKYREQAA